MTEICEEAKAQLLLGNKIAAIKAEREASRIGLKEAKEKVEAHVAQSPEAYPELKTVQVSGTAVATVCIVLAGIVAYVLVGK